MSTRRWNIGLGAVLWCLVFCALHVFWALGGDAGLHPDYWLRPAVSGDRYLMCSDGLFGELPDDVMARLLTAGDPQAASRRDAKRS